MTDLRLILQAALAVLMLGAGICSAQPSDEANRGSSSVQMLQQGLDNEITLKVWTDPADDIVVTQQVNLNIEVATSSYFVGGTQISRLEMEGATVLKRDAFAVNSTRKIGASTWATQLWTFTIYPQRPGTLYVPELRVVVKVADSNGMPNEKTLLTSAIEFTARVPEEIKQDQEWVAAIDFKVTESYDQGFDTLKKGDAIERTITFTAENLAAMMLPAVKQAKVEGLGVYAKPPKLDDKVNRGDYLASRVESIVYVVEEDGLYSIPAMQFYWWDLKSNELKAEELPELSFATKQSVAAKVAFWFKGLSFLKGGHSIWFYLGLSFALIGGFIAALVGIRRRSALPGSNLGKERKALEKAFMLACRNEDYLMATRLLYRWFDASKKSEPKSKNNTDLAIRSWLFELAESTQADAFEELMRYAYSDIGSSANKPSFESFLRQLDRASKKKYNNRFFIKPVDLKLN